MEGSAERANGKMAFGAPGIEPRWTSSNKEAVGCAYSTSSRVWFTCSHGIINEIYYPTIDRPQTRDLQLLITDGETFFHEEKRDLDSEIECIDEHSLGWRIVNRDREGRYEIEKEIIADPHQSCVLMRCRVKARGALKGKLKVYVLLAPHLEVGGWGNSARRYRAAGRDMIVAWKGNTHLALGSDRGFSAISCGYAGESDGWQDLKRHMEMTWLFERAEDGNIACTARVNFTPGEPFTVGVAFGEGPHAAVTQLVQSLSLDFDDMKARFAQQWHRVCGKTLDVEKASGDGGRLFRTSHKLLLAHEDKTYAGAMIASASIPWGQVKGDEDLGGYHLVWTRDMVNSAMGLLAAGDKVTPRRALIYLACSQRADGGFPQNFWIDGRPYWSGIQLDEVAFPLLLAWRLDRLDALGEFDPYPLVKAAAAYLVREGPATEQERWEENSGYSPSTLAVTIAALICAAEYMRSKGDANAAAFLEDYADFLESHLERWTVTTEGEILPDVPRHYIRIHPTDVTDPRCGEDPNHGVLVIPNRAGGQEREFPAKMIVDPGFLELVRYGVRKPGDPLVEDSLRVVDAVLKVDTPLGPCWRRYSHDGYGQKADGAPYDGTGKGRAWPLLTGERGHYELSKGEDAGPYIRAMEGFASRGGMLPEQVWDEEDLPEHGMYLGRQAGSAMPLMWAHAEYIKLLRSVSGGDIYDCIRTVAERYREGAGRRDLEVWKPKRQVARVRRGDTLRVQAPWPFRLRWTKNEWQTHKDVEAEDSGLEIWYTDVKVTKSQKAPVRFTFFRLDSSRWEGRDYRLDLDG